MAPSSFLLLRVDTENSPFALRPLKGIDPPHGHQSSPELMVLDGQQRLTSLHYVFAAPSFSLQNTKKPYRFFLDLKKLLSDDIDEAIVSERSDNCKNLLKPDNQFMDLIIPFTQVEKWTHWHNAYLARLAEQDPTALVNHVTNVAPVWNDTLDKLQHFTVPTITIPKVLSTDTKRVAEVCAIFEKMNSTGEALSVFDLLTARLFKNKIRLRDLWKEAIGEYDLLGDFSEGKSNTFGKCSEKG